MKNELFRPYGIGNNLDFPIRDRGRTIGLLAICREPGSSPFTHAEVAAVLSLREHFRHAMTLIAAPPVCDDLDESALAIIAPDGSVAGATVAARVMLSRLRSPGEAIRLAGSKAPPVVMAMAGRLWSEGRDRHAPSCDVENRWGRFRIAAELVTPGGEAVMSLRRFRPKILRRMEKARSLELSPRERQVALAMCQDAPADALATGLGLSVGTYRQMAKRVYARLETPGRDGVRRLLDS